MKFKLMMWADEVGHRLHLHKLILPLRMGFIHLPHDQPGSPHQNRAAVDLAKIHPSLRGSSTVTIFA